MLSQIYETCTNISGILLRFLKNLQESTNLVCWAKARTKTALGIIQLWFDCFTASFFKALGFYFSREARERNALVVGAFTPVFLLCMGMVTSVCQSFRALSEHHAS